VLYERKNGECYYVSGYFASEVSIPMSFTLSPLLRIMVSPSTTLVHLKVWELEQEAKTGIGEQGKDA